MANIRSFPNNQDEYIGAEDVMRWHHGRSSGVFGADNNAAVGPVLDAMAITVSDGIGWISNAAGNGVVWWVDEEAKTGAKLQIPVDIADAVLPRIDRVVVSWQTTNYVALPEVIVLKGTPASAPKAPALTNDSMVRQISIAAIRIPAGATAIDASMITDERLDASVCGIVTELVGVDTSVMKAQFDGFYTKSIEEQEAYIAQQKAAWEAYFEAVEGDTLVPVPTPADARKALLVNETGDGYDLEEIQTNIPVTSAPDDDVELWIDPDDENEIITLEKLGGAPMPYAKKVGAPHNLLDNSDFRNPVNQRGQSKYTGTSESVYTIDRWRKRGTNEQCEVVVESGGVRIKRIVNNGYTGIAQVLEFDEARFGEKTLTFAVKVKECGTPTRIRLVSSTTGTDHSSSIGEAVVDTVGIHTVTATIPAGFKYPYFGVAIVPGSSETGFLGAAGDVVVEWCALYEGEYTAETLPKYQPKGYAAELMECRRYFYNMSLATKAGVLTGANKTLRFGIPMPVIMRLTEPTVTEVSVSGLRTTAGSIDPPTINTVTATIYKDGWLDLMLNVEAISAATNNTPVCAYVGAVISADL